MSSGHLGHHPTHLASYEAMVRADGGPPEVFLIPVGASTYPTLMTRCSPDIAMAKAWPLPQVSVASDPNATLTLNLVCHFEDDATATADPDNDTAIVGTLAYGTDVLQQTEGGMATVQSGTQHEDTHTVNLAALRATRAPLLTLRLEKISVQAHHSVFLVSVRGPRSLAIGGAVIEWCTSVGAQ